MRHYLILTSMLMAACNNDTVTTTDSSGSSGSTGSLTSGLSTTTDPSTTALPTTDCGTGCVTISTSDVSTSDVSTSSTTDVATSSTTDVSTGSSSGSGSTGSSSGSGSSGMGDLCQNGVLDQDETDIDCGGAICGDCLDGQICLVNEDCVSMACGGGLCVVPECAQDADCAMLNDPCNQGTCDLGAFTCVKTPVMDGLVCDDADLCTTNDVCTAGACAGGPKDCTLNDTACGVGVCNAMSGACETLPEPKKDGEACDDNNGCTANTTCLNGACGDPNNKGYAFYEPFANNMAGWTLDTNWEIKPAVASMAGGGNTGTDPADDHTPSMDKGVAGQLIGGLLTDANTPLNTPRCLTSPVVDTAMMPTVWLTFWRHLHADYPNWSVQRIEVFNGNAWVLLQTGYGPPVTNDANWTEVKFDISAHKSATTRFRICHSRAANGSYNHGGWSVDDVTFAPIACTP